MSKTIRQLWRDEFCRDGMCILCCNTGEVQTSKQWVTLSDICLDVGEARKLTAMLLDMVV
jgi:hypothetical protein